MQLETKPNIQPYHIEGVKHISPEEAYYAVKNNLAIMVDVREEYEFETEKIALDDILYHPMSVILQRLKHIPNEKFIVVVCKNGERSTKVANLFNRQGFKDVANLDGGIETWKKYDLPVTGTTKKGGCSCGCSCGS